MNKLCWKATWSLSLLLAIGFKENSNQICFSQDGGNEGKDMQHRDTQQAPVAPGWALGSMLVDVNFYPWGVPER